jgi:hypothetical protein
MSPRVPTRARVERRWALALICAAIVAGCSPSPNPTSTPAAAGSPAVAGTSGAGGEGAGDGGDGGDGGERNGPFDPELEDGVRRSLRGLGCSVKNDCKIGFSCIQGVCQPSSFGLSPSAKECVQIDCETSADCCQGLPTEVPDKCRSRASACLKTLPGCEKKPCARTTDCGGGGVCTGRCAVTSGECTGNVDCLANKCVSGKCSLNFNVCGSDADCAANTCTGGSCACDNPTYVPLNPVCSDPDCEALCLWACEASRCVIPTTCKSNSDCFGSKPVCVKGACAECATSDDCSFDRICLSGSCETPCQNDAQCGLFEGCQAGECIYVGCRSNRECTLIPDVRLLALPAGVDARLLRCHTQKGIGQCLIPCQTDSQCATTEVCSGGLCQYIGCDTTAECKTILGVHDQVGTDEHPWIASVECRANDASP